MPALLFEIGTEEIPARFMAGAIKQLAELAESFFTEKRLLYTGLTTYGTPRRLALLVEHLAERQPDLVKEVKGPAKKTAFDAEGNPTKAAQGFARSQGVAVEELLVKEINGGEYLYAYVKEEGKATSEILPEILSKLVTSLSFPKPMRWGTEDLRFARPIRWLVALYGNQVVELELAGVKAGRETRGHRFLSKGSIALDNPQEYLGKLEAGFVIADQDRRRRLIWQQIEAEAAKIGGSVEQDEELLEEVTFLVEYPTALCGSFAEKYLELPQEVLITPMKEHQRYFPVWSKEDKKLLPKFITVRNGSEVYLENVIAGNEKVLLARLADAQFFYQEDRRVPLKDRIEQLQKVVFQESLGTVYEKVQRIKALAVYIAEELNWADDVKALVQECAGLCKADLVTNMVYEFPELQGIMGDYYARLEGYDTRVAQGIREHYQPRFAGDEVPQSAVGLAVGIADKLDTIVGCFGIGLVPTGSQDPYALRRQALGICHIIIQHNLRLSLNKLTAQACRLYEPILAGIDAQKVNELMQQFFRQRVQNILEERGIRYDVIDAVLAVGHDDLADTVKRAEALQDFGNRAEFVKLVTAFTRAANLTKYAKNFTVQEGFFIEDVEKKLFNAVQRVRQVVEEQTGKANYMKALEILSSLQEPVDDFFSEVMVMVDDERIKENRLGLLQMVVRLTCRIADLSKLAVK